MNNLHIFVRSLVFLSVLLFCNSLFSADITPEQELLDTLEEVVVSDTRIRFVESQNSVAKTTLFSKQLSQQQRLTPKDVSAVVPNLYIPDYGSSMTSTIYLRGLGTRIDQPVMGLYIDGVGIANKNSFDADFLDVRSLAVYRGPQGSLFGKNTIGGVMSITTVSPFDFQGFKLKAGYANHNVVVGNLSYYALIKDNIGLSVAGAYRHSDGFFVNKYDNKRVDWHHSGDVHLKFEHRVDSTFTYSHLAYLNLLWQGGFPYHLQDEPVNHNDFCGYKRQNLLYAFTFNKQTKHLIIGSTLSYQLLFDRMDMDNDHLPQSYFTLSQQQKEHSVREELTLKPKKEKEHWNWLTGASIGFTHNDMHAPVTFLEQGIDSLILKNANNGIQTMFPNWRLKFSETQFPIDSRFRTNTIEAAVYHTSYFNVGNWQFEVGLRLEADKKYFDYNSTANIHFSLLDTDKNTTIGNGQVPVTTQLKGTASLLSLEVLPRVAVSYHKNILTLFASVAAGYHAGGFNTQLFSDLMRKQMQNDLMENMHLHPTDNKNDVKSVIIYKPEHCLTSELGMRIHKQWKESNLTSELVLFETELFNQQQTVFPEKSTGRMMTNAGRSRSFGAELSLNFNYKQLSLFASYGYTNARFIKYKSAQNDYKNKRIPYIPLNTLAAGVTYSFDLKHNFFQYLRINANTTAVGKIFWNEQNDVSQPFYALLNANLELQTKYFTLALWGKNLTCTKYNVFYFESIGNRFLQSGKPVSFGVEIRAEI